MCIRVQVAWEPKGDRSPRAEVIGGCELPDIGAGN